tara:strand:- start:39169 stop:39528 length:360 start_codon:yes stop_codon:yes gene_type:complete
MAKLITEIKLLDMDELKTLFELFSDNIDCIKEPLRSRFIEWIEAEDKGWVSWSDIAPEFIDNESCSVLVDGKDALTVCEYNKILRKVKVFHKKPNRIEIVNAKSFSINNIGFANFVEWS